MASLNGKEYFFPRVILDGMLTARAWMAYFRYKKVLSRNLDIKNSHTGDTVYILGNGPSLNNYDLASISADPVITMNHFELHPLKDRLNIIAHCIGESFDSPTWEDPTPMISGVRAESYWFHTSAIRYFNHEFPQNYYFYLSGIPYAAPWAKRLKLTGPAIGYQSTAQMAIAVAIYMGFKKIYLLGLDHDWLVTRGSSPHFYEDREGMDLADLSAFSYLQMIEISRTLFRIYLRLRDIANAEGCTIYNMSNPSYLDVFPRREGEDA